MFRAVSPVSYSRQGGRGRTSQGVQQSSMQGAHQGVQQSVAGVIAGVALVAWLQRRWGHCVAAAPDVHLLVAMLRCCLSLIEALWRG
jgi:hypothetical protein